MKKRDSLNIIEGLDLEEEDLKEKIKEPWVAIDEQQRSKLEIEKAPSWLPSNPPCIQENNKKREEDLKVMVEEDMKNDPDEKVNQGNQIYIEVWLKKSTIWGITTFFNNT